MDQQTSSFWLRFRGPFVQGLLLAAVWLFISGKFETAYLFWGAISIAIVLALTHPLRTIPITNNGPIGASRIIIPRLILYLFWLLWEMVKSGVSVAYLIVHPRLPIDPLIVTFTSKQPNVIAKVILGNSITLTPGTLTLDISGDRFTVHALTLDTAEDPLNGEMGSRVSRLYVRGKNGGGKCSELFIEGRGR